MEFNLEEKYLPIGSTVMIENFDHPVVIISVRPEVMMDNGERGYIDYGAILHPFGFTQLDDCIYFSTGAIKEVLTLGYMNDEYEKMTELISIYTGENGEEAIEIINKEIAANGMENPGTLLDVIKERLSEVNGKDGEEIL